MKPSFRLITGAGLVLALFTVTATAAHAAPLSNGNFTGGLAGWTSAGNVSLQSELTGPTPSGDLSQALIANVSVLPTYALGTDPALTGAALHGALGLGAGVLDALRAPGDTGSVVFGSALTQTFTANAGDVLSFNWNFLTDESANPLGNDFAFVVLDGSATLLANTFKPQGATTSVFTNETGFKAFSKALAAGSHTLSIGVVDVNDALGSSALVVDHVAVASVPEPDTTALVVAGIALCGVVALKRRAG